MNRSNNNLSLDEIASEYYNEIFKFCRRRVRSEEDTYDLTQNVFLALSERYKTIDIRCVRKWLYNVARNKITDYYRKNRNEKEYITEVDITDEAFDYSFDFTNYYTDLEIENYTIILLSNLNEKEKVLYNELFHQKLSYLTLANKYNVSEVSLRKRISRLKYKITQQMKLLLYLYLFTL